MHAMLRVHSSSGVRIGAKPQRNGGLVVVHAPLFASERHHTLVVPLRAQPEQQSPPKPVAEEEDLPPWVKAEKERKLQAQQPISGLPWPLYLLFSSFTAIAAVGSIFEFIDRNPIFGVLPPDNPLWAPILLFFAVTGFPTAGFLFVKGVNGFNEAAERQDKIDGFM